MDLMESTGLMADLFGDGQALDANEQNKQLCIIAYDVSCPRRLSRVAKTLLDYGLRRQYSLFECYLHPESLQCLWNKLLALINPQQDRVVVYVIDKQSSGKTLFAGTMQVSEKPLVYDAS